MANTNKVGKQFTAYIPPHVLMALKLMARRERRSSNAQLIWFLEQGLAEEIKQMEYDAEEQWNVEAALGALRTMGEDLSSENITWWLGKHAGEEHAYGEIGPVQEEKIEAIIADLQSK